MATSDELRSGRERLFVALRLPPELAQPLFAEVTATLAGARGLRLVRPELLHVTLAFLGAVPRDERGVLESALAHALADVHAPRLSLARSGVFRHRRRPGALWIGLEDQTPPALDELVRRVRTAVHDAGLALDERGFQPHLTVARASGRGRGARPVVPASFESFAPGDGAGISWTPRAVTLVRSEPAPAGPAYATLARWTLLAPAVE